MGTNLRSDDRHHAIDRINFRGSSGEVILIHGRLCVRHFFAKSSNVRVGVIKGQVDPLGSTGGIRLACAAERYRLRMGVVHQLT